MLRSISAILISLGLGPLAAAQQPSPPQVKVNVLNVCSPSPEEQQEIASALARVPKQPLFAPDFEIDRGRSSLEERPGFLQPGESAQLSPDSATATWVRIRREFSVQALFSTVQYSFSTDPKNMVETLVFRVRDPKELMQVSIEDSASAVTAPAAMLATNTPASRIKLERFGKSSVVLARCSASEAGPAPGQSAYRRLLGARHTVPDELARIGTAGTFKPKPPAKTAKKSVPEKK
ncbi:MAG: hypothetical protein AUH86_04955 [Acidobacteria bacterium 13_1_40CM_4_58_4]|nr:MAG: hypothetical protein AUH86_04955 [Acidobacteria bacterium 13_1_40CM_4_58_4]